MQSKYLKFILGFFALVILTIFIAQEFRAIRAIKDVGVVDTLEPHDCGVVLTGASGRLRESFEVLAQKKIRKLIISGVFKEAQLHEIFPHLPFYPEVNPEDIILEKISGSTYGNAVQSLAVVQTLRCHNIVLITSQLHMYRSYKLFRTIYPESISITPYPVLHLAKEITVFDVGLETMKSVFYSALGPALTF
ncbi:MAG: YdcF family protein [Bdellovibrionaceae bacterium]|nr:YdcF family protein [Bdellovibrio sp.]